MRLISALHSAFVLVTIIAVPLRPVSALSASEDTPLRIVFQKQKDPSVTRREAKEVGDYLSAKLHSPVTVHVPTDHGATVTALVNQQADIAYIDSMSAVLAERDGQARILLAELRPSADGSLRSSYESLLLVRRDSSLSTIDDLKISPAEVSIAFSGPTSTSGFLIPMLRFSQEGLLQEEQDPKKVFKHVSFAGGYTQAMQQVLSGSSDVAAVSAYAFEGASAEMYLPKSQREELKVLARTPGVPTHVMVARRGLSPEVQAQFVAAVLELAQKNPKLLSDVYGAASFAPVDGSAHVANTKAAMELLGLRTSRAG